MPDCGAENDPVLEVNDRKAIRCISAEAVHFEPVTLEFSQADRKLKEKGASYAMDSP
jgi:hypothetical protein